MTNTNKLTSNDIQPGPFSEHELRERWNKQADEFNQWDSLDSHEQLALAQTCAIKADRARAKLPIEREAKVQTITVQTPSFEELRDWILREGQFSPCGTELLQCLMLMTPAPAKSVYSPSIEELGTLIAWLNEEACQASNSGAPHAARMLCWAAQVVGERVDEDAPDPSADGDVAELVDWLGAHAEDWVDLGLPEWADKCSRIRDLLQQRHPAPVAASERPWEREGWCDADGRCWIGHPEEMYSLGESGDFDIEYATWRLEEPPFDPCKRSVSLPAGALPIPNPSEDFQP